LPAPVASMSVEHRLKAVGHYVDGVGRGVETLEVRKNDRAFQRGDTLVLMRYENTTIGLRPTVPFRTIRKRITYLLQGGQFGIDPGYCVLGLADEEAENER